MERISGNHIGIVVNTEDPENRGRVQVFIPHISTTLYKNWNQKLKNISFRSFTDSIFDADVKERLLSVLPWAEAAVPIWGGGTGAPINQSTGSPVPFPTDRSFSYQGATADYKKLFAPNKSDAGLSENMKTSLGGFAANFPNAVITSAKRDYVPEGGSQTSLHLSGNAIDVAMPASPVEQERIVNWWMTQGGATEIGWEGNHIHVGFRQDGSKSVFWRNSPSESIKTNLAGSPSWFQNLGSQYKNGTLQRYAQAPKTNEAVSGNVNPIEMVAKDGLNSSDGEFDSKLTNKNATISEVKNGMGLQTQAQADNAAVAYKTAYDESIRLGASPTQANTVASSIIGNISQESYFDNNTPHDGGKGYGLLGENLDIRARMEQYAATKGESISNGGISTKTQIEALFREPYFLGNERKGNFNNLKNMSNVPDGAVLFAKGYLLPTAATANYDKRANQAIAAANTFSNVDLNTISGSGSNGNNLFRTTNQALMATGSYHAGRIGGPAGMFSCPAVGAKVWVFFQAENSQKPVYFANTYEPSNAIAAG